MMGDDAAKGYPKEPEEIISNEIKNKENQDNSDDKKENKEFKEAQEKAKQMTGQSEDNIQEIPLTAQEKAHKALSDIKTKDTEIKLNSIIHDLMALRTQNNEMVKAINNLTTAIKDLKGKE